jgi:formylglycine-generating enzyme required for sulfatase activity
MTASVDAKAAQPSRPSPAQPAERARQTPGKIEARSGSQKIPVYVLGIAGGLVMIGLIAGLVALVTSSPTAAEDVPPSTASLGDTWIRPADDMVMVYVPAGRFLMGSDQGISDEQPMHEVSLDAFWIDQTEVSIAQYNRCVAAGECDRYAINPHFEADDLPVVGVSWLDADVYCAWAGGQLPTEAQWEYAARGEDSSVYPWGNVFSDKLLNFCDTNCPHGSEYEGYDDGFELTAPVGSYPGGASWTGAYDMAGNVWEWVADWYDSDYYDDSPLQDPSGPASGEARVLRGGSWDDALEAARSSNRFSSDQTSTHLNSGFRCAFPV